MKQGPLTEKELKWLGDILMEYGNDDSILDVTELDGMLTAILSGPNMISPSRWLSVIWGGNEHAPHCKSRKELMCFMDLTFQHMNDIADRLCYNPDHFAPLFEFRTIDNKEYIVAEEWCFGYMRGVALDDWSALPKALIPELEAIALHGKEENFQHLENMSSDEIQQSIAKIPPAALRLHAHYLHQRRSVGEIPLISSPHVATPKVGRNDPCPCSSGKKFKQCCLH
ncbi:YecA family protein [Salmonella enterica subsp. enterica serovar Java]|nr:YecA family protein [Salmonella enterica subsp. enterica serovar Java]ECB7404143.1 YecA family protein [Salmonella enterica subsp. enterica serovar Java]EHE8612566.1 YecA family protein [Salmonella enterica subsp. enterica serovar 4,[5],12:b:-]HAE4646798.1 YecA family protein [Salmonella enterica subsp. enterica serovar 4,[5],12:b:-]